MAVTFKATTLDNGLSIIAECDPDAHSAAAGFFVRTGARDEEGGVMGVSHFLEHMMFKGTDRRTAEELNRAFDDLGARNNAYTTSEMTCFHATVLPERLLGEGGAVDLLADMMRPTLREEDFNTEKKVILEEIAMYEDEPFWVLYERVMEEHFKGHPLAHRVLGTRETIAALKQAQMRAYFHDRYSADNTVVALAGRVEFDAVVGQMAAACGGWERTKADRANHAPETGDREVEIRSGKVTRAYAMLISPAPAVQDEARYAASLAAQILGGPDNSRLHWSLIETGRAEQADAGYDPRDGVGDFTVSVVCDPERAEEVWGVVEREIAGLVDSLTEADLERIRARVATGVTLAGERPGGRMQRLGRQWAALRRYTTLEDELDRINHVTLDDVRGVLEAYPLRPRTVGRLLPE